MSTVIQFPSVRPAVNCIELVGEPEYVTVAEHGDLLFVTDRQLGQALGYVEPLVAIEQLFAKYRDEMGSFLIDLHQVEPEGRTRVRVFDLEAAMRICKLARTPAAGLLYARLGGRAIAEFVVGTAGAMAQVLPFPQRKKPRKPGKDRRHG